MDKEKSSVAVAKATEMSTLFYGTLHHSSYQLPASLSLVFSAVKCNLHYSPSTLFLLEVRKSYARIIISILIKSAITMGYRATITSIINNTVQLIYDNISTSVRIIVQNLKNMLRNSRLRKPFNLQITSDVLRVSNKLTDGCFARSRPILVLCSLTS